MLSDDSSFGIPRGGSLQERARGKPLRADSMPPPSDATHVLNWSPLQGAHLSHLSDQGSPKLPQARPRRPAFTFSATSRDLHPINFFLSSQDGGSKVESGPGTPSGSRKGGTRYGRRAGGLQSRERQTSQPIPLLPGRKASPGSGEVSPDMYSRSLSEGANGRPRRRRNLILEELERWEREEGGSTSFSPDDAQPLAYQSDPDMPCRGERNAKRNPILEELDRLEAREEHHHAATSPVDAPPAMMANHKRVLPRAGGGSRAHQWYTSPRGGHQWMVDSGDEEDEGEGEDEFSSDSEGSVHSLKAYSTRNDRRRGVEVYGNGIRGEEERSRGLLGIVPGSAPALSATEASPGAQIPPKAPGSRVSQGLGRLARKGNKQTAQKSNGKKGLLERFGSGRLDSLLPGLRLVPESRHKSDVTEGEVSLQRHHSDSVGFQTSQHSMFHCVANPLAS